MAKYTYQPHDTVAKSDKPLTVDERLEALKEALLLSYKHSAPITYNHIKELQEIINLKAGKNPVVAPLPDHPPPLATPVHP